MNPLMDYYWLWPVWVYRAVVTQANASGGAVVIDVTPANGHVMLLHSVHAVNSGTNTVQMAMRDEDNNRNPHYVQVASAATTEGAMPQSLAGTGTDGAIIDSTDPLTRLIHGDGTNGLVVQQTGAGAQNDTITLHMRAFLNPPIIPTVSIARSTNSGDVTIGTPTVNKIMSV